MLLQLEEQLEDLIVKLLAEHRTATASWLHKEICLKKKPYTLQAIYHELINLERQGIVVKTQKLYSLKLTWVVNLANFAGDLRRSLMDKPVMSHMIPEPDSVLKWQFSDLARLDDCWEQILFALCSLVEEKEIFEWIPHLWFYLVNVKEEEAYNLAQKALGLKVYRLIGSKSYLDKHFGGKTKELVHKLSFKPGPFAGKNAIYFDLFGDYIITAKFDKGTTARIEELFEQIKSKKDLSEQAVNKFFSYGAKATLKVEHNKRKASKLRKQFKEFWGLK